MATDGNEPYEDRLYDLFPAGAEAGFGPAEGYNTWVQVNDPRLFTPEALENPAIRAFLDAPFSVSFGQFKSSHREAEYFIHKPARAMTGRVEGIEGTVSGMPDDPSISTLVLNHERTLARWITRSLVVEDGRAAGQIIHKEEEGGT